MVGDALARSAPIVRALHVVAVAALPRSGALAAADLDVLTHLMAHSVSELQAVLADKLWDAPEQQLRRSVPESWSSRT